MKTREMKIMNQGLEDEMVNNTFPGNIALFS